MQVEGVILFVTYFNHKLQFIGETIANESLPCVKGGGSRSETEGL